MSIERLVALAQKTGGHLIIHDPSKGKDVVIIDVDEFERLVDGASASTQDFEKQSPAQQTEFDPFDTQAFFDTLVQEKSQVTPLVTSDEEDQHTRFETESFASKQPILGEEHKGLDSSIQAEDDMVVGHESAVAPLPSFTGDDQVMDDHETSHILPDFELDEPDISPQHGVEVKSVEDSIQIVPYQPNEEGVLVGESEPLAPDADDPVFLEEPV